MPVAGIHGPTKISPERSIGALVKNIVAKTGRSEAEALAQFTGTNPQGRLIQPDEVAHAVLWLCNDLSASITGQALSVSGGEVM